MYEDEDYSEGDSSKLKTLKRRKDYVLLSQKGNRITTRGMVVEFAKISDLKSANDDFKSDADESAKPNKTKNTKKLPARKSEEPDVLGFSSEVGYTASKKVGSAVFRNRAKRRMKEAARKVLQHNPKLFKSDYRYNFIARHSTIERDFESLVRDMKYALHNVDGKK